MKAPPKRGRFTRHTRNALNKAETVFCKVHRSKYVQHTDTVAIRDHILPNKHPLKTSVSGLLYLAGNLSASAVPLILLPVLTRALDPSAYGQTVSFTILIAFWQTIIGLNSAAAVGVYWYREPHAISEYTSATLVIILATGIVGLGLSPFLARDVMGNAISESFARLAVVVAMMNAIVQCRVALWQSKQKVKSVVALQVVSALVNISISLALVLVFPLGSTGRNFGIVLTSIVMAVISVSTLAKGSELVLSFNISRIQKLFSYGLPLVFHSLAAFFLGSNDRWMVAGMLSAHDLGIYGATTQIGSAMFLIADAFVKAYTPWVYERFCKDTTQDRLRIIGSIYAAIPAFFLLALFGLGATLLAMETFLGSLYQGGSNLLPIILLGGAMNAIYMCFAPMYFYTGKTKLLATISVASACIGATVSYVLTLNFGLTGAALGSAVTWALLAVGNAIVAVRTFDLPWGSVRKGLEAWQSSGEISAGSV